MATFLTIILIITAIIVPLLVIYFSLKFLGIAFAPVVLLVSLVIVIFLFNIMKAVIRIVRPERNDRKS